MQRHAIGAPAAGIAKWGRVIRVIPYLAVGSGQAESMRLMQERSANRLTVGQS